MEVRFFAKPEIARLVRERDADVSKAAANKRQRAPAVIRARSAAEEVSATLGVSDGVQSYQLPGKVVTLTATLAMPLMQTPTGWFYRDQVVKAGANLVFETASYMVRGMVLNVELAGASEPTRTTTKR